MDSAEHAEAELASSALSSVPGEAGDPGEGKASTASKPSRRRRRILIALGIALPLVVGLAYNRHALSDLGKTDFDEVQLTRGLVLNREPAAPFTGTLLLRDDEISRLGEAIFNATALEQWMDADTQGLLLEVEVDAGMLSGAATLSVDLRRSAMAAERGQGLSFALAKWFAPRQRIASASFSEGRLDGKASLWQPVGSGLGLRKFFQANFKDNQMHGQVLRYYESGERLSEMNFESGEPFGMQREHYLSGEIASELEITKTGTDSKQYYRNGQLRLHQIEESGQRISSQRWFPDGSQKSVATYEGGDKVSEKGWYSNGALAIEGSVLDPLTHAPSGVIREFHDNGALWAERHFTNGVLDGPFKLFYESEQPWEEGNYVHGNRDGLHRKWWKNGQKALESSWSSGEQEGEFQRWYANGKPWEQAEYRAGQRVGSYRKWWKNGKIAHDYQYQEGKPVGVYKTFYDNGQARLESNYRGGRLHGEYKNWLRDGKVYELATYEAGTKIESSRSDTL